MEIINSFHVANTTLNTTLNSTGALETYSDEPVSIKLLAGSIIIISGLAGVAGYIVLSVVAQRNRRKSYEALYEDI